MLTSARALMQSRASGGREFPRVPEFYDVYNLDWHPRYGELSMMCARSGQGKSTFALFAALRMGLKTLYFSGDMSPFQASVKVACAVQHKELDDVLEDLDGEGRDSTLSALPDNIVFRFGEITFAAINRHIDAYVELYNEMPELIVVDNLMDMEGCSEDYTAQMQAMQKLHNLNRETGCAVWVLAHMTDKGEKGRSSPMTPAPRSEIKNGLSEKPETILSLALNPHTEEMNVAIVKNRMGRQDASAQRYVALDAIPEESRFVRKGTRQGEIVEEVQSVGSREEDKGSGEREESQSGGTVGSGHGEQPAGSGLRLRKAPPLRLAR